MAKRGLDISVLRGFGPWPWKPFGRPLAPLTREEQWVPAFDIYQRDDEIVIRADLPGVQREDIRVTVSGDAMVIQGKRQEVTEIKRKHYFSYERVSGAFCRAIHLPKEANPDAINATYQDGVLEVKVSRVNIS